MTVDQLLANARAKLRRVRALDVPDAMADGAVLVDIRADFQRARDGIARGSLFIPRNVLEWRCAPTSPWRESGFDDPQRRVILLCHEGYQSSLAAVTLQKLGLPRATDVIGGFESWRAAGLPIDSGLTEATVTERAYAPRGSSLPEHATQGEPAEWTEWAPRRAGGV
ncbi:MAG: hypothetical protein NVS2B6_08270 [Thermoleophilaceae bacterium]